MASKLTQEDAIKISREEWTWLLETGRFKDQWPGWKKYGAMAFECPLCQYARVEDENYFLDDCSSCPYYQKFGRCISARFIEEPHTPFAHWARARTAKIRKKYAKLFLEQLEQL